MKQASRTYGDGAADGETSPFAHIALALSGGGFRAAGYHLGVLTILHRHGLLERVRAVSGTSAGAIVGLRWMQGLARGESYPDTLFAISKYLSEASPLDGALEHATTRGTTLTQGVAEQFESTLFADSRHPTAQMRELFDARTHLEEASFGATEARSGRAFHFSISRGASARVGREGCELTRRSAEHLRLADVAAACSAFPGSLDPLVLPRDFHWPDADAQVAATESLGGTDVELVHGGLHDNQGIDGLVHCAQRLSTSPTLYLASDAAIDRDASPPPPSRTRFGLSVRMVSWMSWLLVLGALGTIGLLALKAKAERDIGDFRVPSDAVAYGAPTLFCLATIVAVLYARSRVKRAMAPLMVHFGKRAAGSLRKARVSDVLSALHDRGWMLGNVARVVLPRRIRGLVYRGAWSDPSLLGRRVAAQLASFGPDRFAHVDGLYSPSATLAQTVERAGPSSSLLSLDSEDHLQALMCAGQATLLPHLIEHLELKLGAIRSTWPIELAELDEALRADWDALNATGRPLRADGSR